MLTSLSWVGRLVLPAVASLVPGVSPHLVMYALGALAVLVVMSGPAGAVWIHMNAKSAARCDLRISEARAISAESLAHVLGTIKAGDAGAVEPKTVAEAKALCAKSKLCRKDKPK